MTKNIWEQFDNTTDLAGFEEEVQAAESKGGDFEDLPHGKYEVALDNIELKPTKRTGDPMIVSVFKVVEGPHKGRLIWVNQVVAKPIQMSMGLRFVNSMKPTSEVKFTKDGGMAQLSEDLGTAADDIASKHEFVLEFYENKKGYDQYDIREVFILE